MINSIERYNFFTNKMDFCNTDRIFNLIGLSAGFAFPVDDILRANSREPLYTSNLAKELNYTLLKVINECD